MLVLPPGTRVVSRIAVAIAPEGGGEVRNYGIIGGTLDALDKLIKKLQQPGVELRLVYEAGPCGYVIYRHLKNKGIACVVVACWISWQLTVMFLVLVPFALYILTRVGRTMKRATRRLLERMSTIYKILQEAFAGIKIVSGRPTTSSRV